MAIKRFCDFCGAEINPSSRITNASVRSKSDVDTKNEGDYDLCEPCAWKLKLWLNGKKGENDE